MGSLGVVEFVTLDGVVQGFHGPDERDGFAHSGWGVPYADETAYRAGVEAQPNASAYLFGRRTYEEMARFWPSQPDSNPMAAHLNATPKYVATRTLTELSWRNSYRLEGELVTAVTKLKNEQPRAIVVLGSGELVGQLLEAGLVDTYQLFVHPLVLGSGRQLFPRLSTPLRLRLASATPTSTGVLMLSYETERAQ